MNRKPPGRQNWPDSASRPLVNPLQPSVVYTSASPDALDGQYEGREKAFTYAREGHPNAEALAERLNALEGAQHGIVTGSGMAAVAAALMALLKSGDHAVGGAQLYGRSLRMFKEELPRWGVATDFVDTTSVEAVAAVLRPNTKLILIEVLSNPGLRVSDLDGILALGRKRDIPVLVDNTFTTPALLRPLERGAAIVIESVTKILAGHSDATLGYVGTNDAALAQRMTDVIVTTGMTPSPFDCWIAERGLMTFELRFERAMANAEALAEALASHPKVASVYYPTRADHPDQALAASLMSGGSHLVSFVIEGGRAASNALVEALPDVAFAPTLGDVATTLSHPATSSHRALSVEERAAIGLPEGFFRVSVGCERAEDLIANFRRALDVLPD